MIQKRNSIPKKEAADQSSQMHLSSSLSEGRVNESYLAPLPWIS